MRLDLEAVAKAVGTVAAMAYVVCAGLVALLPEAFTNAVGYVAHADLSGLSRSISWTSFFVGLVAWTLACVLSATATGAVYNRLAKA